MTLKIEEQLGKKQGSDDWIVYRATGYNPINKELNLHIEKIGDARWHRYLDENHTYTFEYHPNSSTDGPDPMEIWELPTKQKKWVDDAHFAIPEYDLVFPQILLYFWHNDNRLSIEWDF